MLPAMKKAEALFYEIQSEDEQLGETRRARREHHTD
jgi:hypothetical protein